ncbi:MAG: hypothetical protein K1Y36_14300 [Blastocatellia bacterium]|nr:hypothetical protein [Blastocatellia bacterium]
MDDSKITIRRETLPVRCEICHQVDLFNPETGVCDRCQWVRVTHPVVHSEFPSVRTSSSTFYSGLVVVRRLFLFAGCTLLVSVCAFGLNVYFQNFEVLVFLGAFSMFVTLIVVTVAVFTTIILIAGAFFDWFDDWTNRQRNL